MASVICGLSSALLMVFNFAQLGTETQSEIWVTDEIVSQHARALAGHDVVVGFCNQDGNQVLEQLRNLSPSTKIVIFTASVELDPIAVERIENLGHTVVSLDLPNRPGSMETYIALQRMCNVLAGPFPSRAEGFRVRLAREKMQLQKRVRFQAGQVSHAVL